jgi:hypothetical protein
MTIVAAPTFSTVWGVVVFGETINHGTLLALTAALVIAVARTTR